VTRETDPTVHYRDIVNSMHEALMVVDRDLVVRFANLAYYELFRADEGDTLGRPIFASHDELSSDDKLRSLLAAVAEHGVTVDTYDIEESFPIIGRRSISLSARRIRRDGVSTDATLVVLADVTEDARVLRQKADAVEHSRAQMTELNHRVKNNLTSVLAMLRLEKRALSDGPARQILERIALRVESIASLYELLAVNSGIGSVQLLGYFRSLCRSIETLSGSADDGWTIEVTGEEVSVGVDEAVNIGAIVNELVANAAKYAFRGRNGAGVVRLHCRPCEGEILIEVRDNGVGLDESDPDPKSTGLGMKLVDVYLSAMGGTLHRNSRPGKGTAVTLRIPRGSRTVDPVAVPAIAGEARHPGATPLARRADVVAASEGR